MGCCEVRDSAFKLKDNYKQSTTHLDTETSSLNSPKVSLLKLDSRNFIRKVDAPITDAYTFDLELGAGTFGIVRSALHHPTGLRRAVKTIVKRGRSSYEAQMMMELEMLRRVDHPNILRAYELYEDISNFHLVTELCTGGELLDRILQWKKPSENMVAKIFHQIISAVAYCHDMSMIHRDIKPENLLFSSPDQASLLKIIDFGVCCLFSPGETFTAKHGTVRFRQPFYIAPEVLRQSYNEKCDIWSCGVVLYVMLCTY
jgi:calcium-dependent protein kinase